MYGVRRCQFILFATCQNTQCSCSITIEMSEAICFNEAVSDIRNVVQGQARPIRECPQYQGPEFVARIDLTFSTQQDIAAYRLDRAARHIHGRVSYGL